MSILTLLRRKSFYGLTPYQNIKYFSTEYNSVCEQKLQGKTLEDVFKVVLDLSEKIKNLENERQYPHHPGFVPPPNYPYPPQMVIPPLPPQVHSEQHIVQQPLKNVVEQKKIPQVSENVFYDS